MTELDSCQDEATTQIILHKGYNALDFPAVALILLITLCLCHSTKESSMLNMVMTVFHVIFFGFVIVACFCNGSAKNLTEPRGFTPSGVRGILDGAAIVYMSYIGYDSVSAMAEEIRNWFSGFMNWLVFGCIVWPSVNGK